MSRTLRTIVSIVLCLVCSTSFSQTLKEDLERIDAALDMEEDFSASHDLRIEAIEKSLSSGKVSLQEQYNLYHELFLAQFSYKFDLAKEALDKEIEIADKLSDKVKKSEAAVDKAYLFCVGGLYLESEQAAALIDTTILSHSKLIDYYKFKQRFYFDVKDNAIYQDSVSTREKVRYYRERILEETERESNLNKYIRVREAIDIEDFAKADSLSSIFLSEMDKSSHDYAELAYYKAIASRSLGKTDEMMHWYANSAIADIRSNTKDVASLQCVAEELLNSNQEIARAFIYTQHSLEDAVFFNGKLRPWQVARSLPAIEKAYNEEQAAHQKRNKILMGTILVLAILMFGVSILVLTLYSKQRKIQKELEMMNLKLQDALSDLSMANAAKEEYIGLFLSMCSKYIDKLKRFMSMSEIDNELKNFYNTFDNAFLELYPDFVEKFNALLRPDARIELKKDELLNTELRIFALIKLGITQSSQIATLLRYSVNTIYNYRAQIKNAAIDGKSSFEDLIKNI